MGVISIISVVLIALLAIAIFALSYFCLRDSDNDAYVFWHNNYGICQRPYIAAIENCKHEGKKVLVTNYVGATCEKVNTHCVDCGKMLIEGEIEC